MSHDPITGEIRPNPTPSPKAIEKRIRRKLAHIGAVLHLNRPNTSAFRVYGGINVTIPATGEVLFAGMTLTQIGVALNDLADGETVKAGAE
jgi:hypothetical protein